MRAAASRASTPTPPCRAARRPANQHAYDSRRGWRTQAADLVRIRVRNGLDHLTAGSEPAALGQVIVLLTRR